MLIVISLLVYSMLLNNISQCDIIYMGRGKATQGGEITKGMVKLKMPNAAETIERLSREAERLKIENEQLQAEIERLKAELEQLKK